MLLVTTFIYRTVVLSFSQLSELFGRTDPIDPYGSVDLYPNYFLTSSQKTNRWMIELNVLFLSKLSIFALNFSVFVLLLSSFGTENCSVSRSFLGEIAKIGFKNRQFRHRFRLKSRKNRQIFTLEPQKMTPHSIFIAFLCINIFQNGKNWIFFF